MSRSAPRVAAAVPALPPDAAGQADERTLLAYERTYTAWLRTGLAALGAGLGARALLGHELPAWLVVLASTSLIALSALLFAAGAWCDRLAVTTVGPAIHTVPRALLRPLNVALVLLSLASLAGVWTA